VLDLFLNCFVISCKGRARLQGVCAGVEAWDACAIRETLTMEPLPPLQSQLSHLPVDMRPYRCPCMCSKNKCTKKTWKLVCCSSEMQLPRTHFFRSAACCKVRSYLLEFPPLIISLWKLTKVFMLPLIMEECQQPSCHTSVRLFIRKRHG
jgi:hypothetical protein